jgi:hypothetical protein
VSKILKNTTGSPISIADTGITIPAGGSYTIPAQDYLLWANSSNIVTPVGTGSIVVNDGSSDLSASFGMDLIKGLFPRMTWIQGGNSPFYNVDAVLGSDARKRLCVDATWNVEQQAQYLTSKWRVMWDGVEISIPQSTTYTAIWTITGTGFFFGTHIDTDQESTQFRIVVDGEVIMTDVDLKFIKDLGFLIGGSVPTQLQNRQLWNSTGADLDISPPLPVRFNSSISLLMRNPTRSWKRQRYMVDYELFT